jgi:hypothetical protein
MTSDFLKSKSNPVFPNSDLKGIKQTLQKKSVGFSPWEIKEIPWDLSVLFFGTPQVFSQLCQFSSDFDVSYHFGIRRQNQ